MTARPTDFGSVAHAGDPGLPLLVLLHGTGGDEHDLVPLARQVLPRAPILGVRGQVNEGGALRFFRRHAEGVLDLADLRRRADGLAAWLRAEAARHGIQRVVALGVSNGANIASALLFQHPGLLAGAALVRPMMIYDPVAPPALTGTRVLLSAGRADPLVPHRHVEALADIYRVSGAEVTLAWQAAGHALVQGDVTALTAFFGGFGPATE